MNKELELEAEKYVEDNYPDYLDKKEFGLVVEDFVAGATSKYAEKQKLEFAIKELMWVNILIPFAHQYAKDCIENKIKELEQKLSEI